LSHPALRMRLSEHLRATVRPCGPSAGGPDHREANSTEVEGTDAP